MKPAWRFSVLAGGAAAGALFLVHCTDDDTVAVPDDGGTADATAADGNAGFDGGTTSDAGDAGAADTSVDTGLDAGRVRNVLALDNQNRLVKFTTASPGAVTLTSITGLAATDTLQGIDLRPSTGQLYALGSLAPGRIYTIDKNTGAAVALDTTADAGDNATGAWLLDPTATSFGFDFNPVADRIRVHTNTGQNLRLHPANGQHATIAAAAPPYSDTALTHEDGGATPTLTGTGYTNSLTPRPIATALFAIDTARNVLVVFVGNPNAGKVKDVGPLGVDPSDSAGFDVVGGTDGDGGAGSGTVSSTLEGFAALEVGGTRALYRINLTTGAATAIGTINHGAPLRGLAVEP